MGTSNPTMWEVSRMSTSFSVRSRSYRSAPRPVFYVLFALVLIGAARATAQSDGTLLQRVDSIAGAGVVENRAVGIVAAVVKGKGRAGQASRRRDDHQLPDGTSAAPRGLRKPSILDSLSAPAPVASIRQTSSARR